MRAHENITATRRSTNVLKFPRPTPPTPPASRLLVPREHGSWGLWLLPLISGAVVGYFSAPNAMATPILWFALAAASAFLIYQPLESLLGLSILKVRSPREQRVALLWVIALVILTTFGALELARQHRALVFLPGSVALACFCVHSLLGPSRSLRLPRQFVGALGLSSTAAGAYCAATGRINLTALLLWLASWLFAVGQIEYVQMRLRSAQVKTRRQKARGSLGICFYYLLIFVAAISAERAGVAPILLAVTFVPAIVRLAVWLARPCRPLSVHVLGISELFQGILFNLLLIAAFLIRH